MRRCVVRRRRPGRHRGGDHGAAARACASCCVDKARFPRDKTCGDGLDRPRRCASSRRLGLSPRRARGGRIRPGARDACSCRRAAGRCTSRSRPTATTRASSPGPASTPRSSPLARGARRRRPRRRRRSTSSSSRDDERRRCTATSGDDARRAGTSSRPTATGRPCAACVEPGRAAATSATWHAVRQYFDRCRRRPPVGAVRTRPAARIRVGVPAARTAAPTSASACCARRTHGTRPEGALARRCSRGRRCATSSARARRRASRCARGRSPPRTRPARLDRRTACCYAGDAAGVVDPMTGEGIAQAIETGIARGRRDRPRWRHRTPSRSGTARTSTARSGRDLRFAARLQTAPRVIRVGARGAIKAAGWTRLDAPQLRPLAVRGLSAGCAAHARPLAPPALHRTRRVLADSRDFTRRSGVAPWRTARQK